MNTLGSTMPSLTSCTSIPWGSLLLRKRESIPRSRHGAIIICRPYFTTSGHVLLILGSRAIWLQDFTNRRIRNLDSIIIALSTCSVTVFRPNPVKPGSHRHRSGTAHFHHYTCFGGSNKHTPSHNKLLLHYHFQVISWALVPSMRSDIRRDSCISWV